MCFLLCFVGYNHCFCGVYVRCLNPRTLILQLKMNPQWGLWELWWWWCRKGVKLSIPQVTYFINLLFSFKTCANKILDYLFPYFTFVYLFPYFTFVNRVLMFLFAYLLCLIDWMNTACLNSGWSRCWSSVWLTFFLTVYSSLTWTIRVGINCLSWLIVILGFLFLFDTLLSLKC